jgi:hypothetical protein
VFTIIHKLGISDTRNARYIYDHLAEKGIVSLAQKLEGALQFVTYYAISSSHVFRKEEKL